jgi:WD40 repeat protein
MDELQHPKMFGDDEGSLFLNFGEYGQQVELACFSSDGTTLLVVKEVGMATVWDVASRVQVGAIHPTSPLVGRADASPFGIEFKVFIESVALNPDGSVALLGLNDGTAGIFSTRDGNRLSTFHLPDANPAEGWCVMRSVRFSLDGSLALVGFPRRTVGIWRTYDHTLVRLLTGSHSDRLFGTPVVRDTFTSTVTASNDNHYVFAGFVDMTATVWSLDSGEIVFEAYQHVENILDLWVAEESVRWATTGGCVWEGGNKAQISRLLDTGETWSEAGFTPNGETVIALTDEGTTRRWSCHGGAETLEPADMYFSGETKTIRFGSSGKVALFTKETQTVVLTSPEKRRRNGFALSPQEDIVATYGWSDTVELWRSATGECVQVLEQRERASTVAFSADGTLLAVGTFGSGGSGEVRPIYVWDTRTGALRCELRGHTHQVHALAFDPHNRCLVSASLDRTVRLWQLDHSLPSQSSEKWRLFYDDLEFDHIAVLSNGEVVVFRTGSVEVWHDQKKRLSIAVPYHFGTTWHITAHGSCLVGTFQHQIIRKWSLDTGQEIVAYQADIARPESLPSSTVVTDNRDRFLPMAGCYLWRTRAGNFLHLGDGPRGWVTPLTFSTDGESIALPGMPGAAMIQVTNAQRLVALMPFEGKLRASCILSNQNLMLSASGRLFIHEKRS